MNEWFKSEIIVNLTRKICKRLDAKYEKAHQNKVITKKCQHLSTKEHEIILTLLRRSEDLCNGTLGTWNTTLVYL